MTSRLRFSSALLAVSVAMAGQVGIPAIQFLGRVYQLASFNEKPRAMWEYAAPGEKVEAWKTLVTLIDRPDAHSLKQMDGLAEGVMANYKSHGAQIVLAKTLQDKAGTPFNYLVAAFDGAPVELDFVKVALGAKNAYTLIYGVRVKDMASAKTFLSAHSGEIGQALEKAAVPEITGLPRRTF